MRAQVICRQQDPAGATLKTFDQAQAHCSALGGALAHVHSEADNVEVLRLAHAARAQFRREDYLAGGAHATGQPPQHPRALLIG